VIPLSRSIIQLSYAVLMTGNMTQIGTPVGHQANVLVRGPGGYRFVDYTRVRRLLSGFILVASVIFLPMHWPF